LIDVLQAAVRLFQIGRDAPVKAKLCRLVHASNFTVRRVDRPSEDRRECGGKAAGVRFHDSGATVIQFGRRPHRRKRAELCLKAADFASDTARLTPRTARAPSARWKPISAALTARPASPSPAR